jgi:hypothetical protein
MDARKLPHETDDVAAILHRHNPNGFHVAMAT